VRRKFLQSGSEPGSCLLAGSCGCSQLPSRRPLRAAPPGGPPATLAALAARGDAPSTFPRPLRWTTFILDAWHSAGASTFALASRISEETSQISSNLNHEIWCKRGWILFRGFTGALSVLPLSSTPFVVKPCGLTVERGKRHLIEPKKAKRSPLKRQRKKRRFKVSTFLFKTVSISDFIAHATPRSTLLTKSHNIKNR